MNAGATPDSPNTRFSLNLFNTYETASPSVENTEIRNPLGRKQKNAYNTIINGLKVQRHKRQRVRFLTFTTSDLQFNAENYNPKMLNDHFRRIKQIIKKTTILHLIRDGYVEPSQIRGYYGNKPLNEKFGFEYFKVITNEGNGVVHCVYSGERLPYNYLVDVLWDVHLSWHLNIQEIKTDKKNIEQSSGYIVSQYISNQGSSYQRSSQSWNWIFRGYRKAWKGFLTRCHTQFFYNPVQRRFYYKRDVVNIFRLWEREIIRRITPSPSPLLQTTLY